MVLLAGSCCATTAGFRSYNPQTWQLPPPGRFGSAGAFAQNGPSKLFLAKLYRLSTVTVWLPNVRRYQPPATDTRGASSCWALMEISVLKARAPHPSSTAGSVVVEEGMFRPKLGVVAEFVSSFSWILPDESNGEPFLSMSLQARVSVRPTVVSGLLLSVMLFAARPWPLT